MHRDSWGRAVSQKTCTLIIYMCTPGHCRRCTSTRLTCPPLQTPTSPTTSRAPSRPPPPRAMSAHSTCTKTAPNSRALHRSTIPGPTPRRMQACDLAQLPSRQERQGYPVSHSGSNSRRRRRESVWCTERRWECLWRGRVGGWAT